MWTHETHVGPTSGVPRLERLWGACTKPGAISAGPRLRVRFRMFFTFPIIEPRQQATPAMMNPDDLRPRDQDPDEFKEDYETLPSSSASTTSSATGGPAVRLVGRSRV